MRGSLEKESENKTVKPSTRRSSAVGFGGREKPPSKDGTVQRHAKGVEGLKDFVSLASNIIPHPHLAECTSLLLNS